MESLSEATWDVLIEGTGLRNSLLALACSRLKDKKILHVDPNDYYGDAEAAFSLQEVDEWVKKVEEGSSKPFRNGSLKKIDDEKLSFSRAYTLTLSPQIIYTRSKLIAQLVSSKVYKQLEFQAVGNWWIYDGEGKALRRLPNGREDIFQDKSIDNRAKRSLMKFLKFVVDYENQTETWEPHADSGLAGFLSSQFQLPANIHVILAALTLSLDPVEEIPVKWALPRIARHLTSIGLFGPGFGAVVPKWGGGAEIAQVACRAGAVGGGVYVLGTGVTSSEAVVVEEKPLTQIQLSNGETVKTRRRIGGSTLAEGSEAKVVSKSISVVSSPLTSLFKSTIEGAPLAAASVGVFQPYTLISEGTAQTHPVYIMIHSSETGECPAGQCVLYATTLNFPTSKTILKKAVSTFLATTEEADVNLLYSLYYEQADRESALDLAFNDEILGEVEREWSEIVKGDEDAGVFMSFEDREGTGDDEEEDGY